MERKSIEREIKIHKQLQHLNIIKLYFSYVKKNTLFLILELCDKGNLFQMLKNRYFTMEQNLIIFYEVVKAISYLHQQNLMHRDIKPENILLDQTNGVKVCDFGFCAAYNAAIQRQTLCGTQEYLPPEIIKNHTQTQSVDVWCLGILLYEMIHKTTPYKARNIVE